MHGASISAEDQLCQHSIALPDIAESDQHLVIKSSYLVARQLQDLQLVHLDQHLWQLRQAVVLDAQDTQVL